MLRDSPPYYGLHNYGVSGQIGLEQHPTDYIHRLTEIFMQVYRVLSVDGTMWIVIGDSYAGSGSGNADLDYESSRQPKASFIAKKPTQHVVGYKNKDLIGIPFMLAAALRNAGWYWRSCSIWHKPSVMPESVKDRPTNSHEYILLFSKNSRYYYNYNSILEECSTEKHSRRFGRKISNHGETFRNDAGRTWEYSQYRNKRSVWCVPAVPLHEEHFAAYPPNLIIPMIKAGSREGDIVLDPFVGAGTTALVTRKLGRKYIGIELNPQYVEIVERRLRENTEMFAA